jgi:Ca2+-transporting ATPase
MQDPPREGIPELLARFRHAGISAYMLTGDQSGTAGAIAHEIGLVDGDGRIEVVDSTRVEALPIEALCDRALHARVFARVNPSQKLTIVRALQHAGYVVAMTGDGINDSPALKAAEVGVALGKAGTSAAREVADVVLLDDDLGTLLAALEEGRTIHDDIRKAVHFVLATNFSEILLSFASVATGAGEALTPMELLWINLLTDVLPELALSVQPPERDVLDRAPRNPNRPMFERRELVRIGFEGVLITLGAGVAYASALSRHGRGARASSVAFATLTGAQLLHAVSSRSDTHSIFDRDRLRRNPLMAPTILGSFALQAIALLVPAVRSLLGTVRLARGDWATAVACGSAPFFVRELAVWLRRRPRSRA